MSTLKESALQYAKMGFRVFPLQPGTKGSQVLKSWKEQATTDSKQIEKWWNRKSNYNIGITTGNGLLVIDLDIKNGKNGIQSLKKWQEDYGELPKTKAVKSPTGGGKHLYYLVDREIPNPTDLYSGIDIRGDGGYVLAPPSIIDGKQYSWDVSNIEIAQANDIVYKFLEGGKPKTESRSSFKLPLVIEAGIREATLFKYACSLQARGYSDNRIKEMILQVNEERCEPPLELAKLENEVFKGALRYDKGSIIGLNPQTKENILNRLEQLNAVRYSWDDKGNGRLFADVFKEIARYNVTAKEWYFYDGKRWVEDVGGLATRELAKNLADCLTIYALNVDPDKQEDYRDHVRKLGNLRFRNTMLDDAKSCNYFSSMELDRNPNYLNCQNGVLDLINYELIPHNPSQLLSKICNVNYDPNASQEEFRSFITEVLEYDEEKIGYLQKCLGYCLSGDTSQEIAFIVYGATTRNGKGTLFETFSYMIGGTKGYANTLKPESLAISRNRDGRQASGDIARLDGARFVLVNEPSQDTLLDVALLKTMTGGDTLVAREIYQRDKEFRPQFKIFINTNYLPRVTDITVFQSGRICVFEFNRHFSAKEQDLTLKSRLKQDENLSGLLNWCLEGLSLMQLEGLKPPPKVVEEATETYQKQSDKVLMFFEECMVRSKENSKAKDVYISYHYWCNENGFKAESKTIFMSKLRVKGLLIDRARVKGISCSNVIKGYEVEDNYTFEMEV